LGNLVQDPNEKVAYYRAALALRPDSAMAYTNLGSALRGNGKLAEAIAYHEKALKLDPDFASGYRELGATLYRQKDLKGAIRSFKKALEIDPTFVWAHNSLGVALLDKKDLEGAAACFSKALEFAPEFTLAHYNLGVTSLTKKDVDGAILHFQRAVKFDSKYGMAHNNLGWCYGMRGEYAKANISLNQGIDLNPKLAFPHYKLSFVLKEAGELKRAWEELKKAQEGTAKTLQQILEGKKLQKELEVLLAFEPRLADIVKGEVKPKDVQESLLFGNLCGVKQYFTAANRFYERAQGQDPNAVRKLEPFDFLRIGRVTLLAAAGKGNQPPPEADRPKYRAKALAWLRQFLHANQQELEKPRNIDPYRVPGNLRMLLQHKDFASVRPPALGQLPAAERKQWESFWRDVEALLQKAN